MYNAVNEDSEMPNIEYPDSDAAKSIIEFHACKFPNITYTYITRLVLPGSYLYLYCPVGPFNASLKL